MCENLVKIYSSKIFTNLFESSKNSGVLNYLYLLLRVIGIQNSEDELFSLNSNLQKLDVINIDNDLLFQNYRLAISNTAPWSLILNLMRCTVNEDYAPFPFGLVNSNDQKNSAIKIYSILLEYCNKLENKALGLLLKKIFEPFVNDVTKVEVIKNSVGIYKILVTELIEVYENKIKNFAALNNSPKRWIKIIPFTILEILSDDHGLYGMKLYFSNGSDAYYKRTSTGTEGYNLTTMENFISPFVGDTSKLKREYMVNDKSFYKIGTPGRYNTYGEWKPLTFDGDIDLLSGRILQELEQEKDKPDFHLLYGTYQYFIATCHHTIEFIIKTNLKFPHEFNSFTIDSNIFQMCLVKFDERISNSFSNMYVYDCSVLLKDISLDNVRFVLESINVIYSRISFQVDCWYEVIMKYPGSANTKMGSQLDKNITNLINYFECFNHEDYKYFDLAIEWHVTANNSDNIFHKFLNYCISLETIAIPFVDGKLAVSSVYNLSENNINNLDKNECIQKIRNEAKNDLDFISRCYLECISPGLAKKIKFALEKVFGEDSTELAEFSNKVLYKKKELSLYDMRSRLAHGNFSLNDKEDLELIRKNLYTISAISNKFIITLLKKANSEKDIKIKTNKDGSFVSILTSDPRSTGITSSLNFFPNKNWKIKMDWLF